MSTGAGYEMQLSLCMIVRDEQHFIGDCLEAARPYVDEIVVVDTGSVDDTRAIASAYADISDAYAWHDDYAAARNHSLALATGEWILVLDADELIDPAGYEQIRELMAGEADGYFLTQANYTDEPGDKRERVGDANLYAKGYEWFSRLPVLRLFRADPKIRFAGTIHETVDDSIGSQGIRSGNVTIHHYLHDDPSKPRRERVARYLALLEKELVVKEDGRLYGIAAASCMALKEDYRKAADYYVNAAKLGYRVNGSMEGAGAACYLGGNLKMAHFIYNDLYTQGVRSLSVCLNLANLEVRQGDAPRAIQLLEEVLERSDLSAHKRSVVENNLQDA